MPPTLLALFLLTTPALAQQPQAPAPAQAQPAAQAPGGRQSPIQFDDNFYYLKFDENVGTGPDSGMMLEAFVKNCQEATGINFTYSKETADALSRTPLRMYGPKTIPKSDFYQFFQIMMIINSFVCTKVGAGPLSVVLIDSLDGQKRNMIMNNRVYVQPHELDKYADQPAVLITTVVDLPNTDVRNLSQSLRQMWPDQTTQQIIPVGSSNSLVITGFGSNVVSVVKMLQFVDAAARFTVTVPEFEVIPLEFASAEDVSETLTELLDASRRASQGRQQVQQAQGVTGQLQAGQAESKIMVDTRTNSLLVMSMPDDMPRIKELIARLDIDVVQSERTYHIYNLDNVDATELQEVLDEFIRDASRVSTATAGRQPGQGGAAAATSSSARNEVVVVADKATNSLLIAANRTRYEELIELIKRLDQRQDQVLIETALVELSSADTFALTVELGLAEISAAGDGGFGVSSFGLSTFQDTNLDGVPDIRVPNGSNGTPANGMTAGIIRGDDFSLPVLLSALKTRRDTNVLNVPSVLVNNNKSAKVVSKDEQPTTTITATGGLNGQTQENFNDYVEAGITLQISPTISASRYLRLDISLEVSTFAGPVSGAIPPPKITRTLETTVNVPDGDTMVIGGIITDNKANERRSVPWLGDIPILGYLFGSNSESSNKTTLFFFVTPHIMRDREFADLAEFSYQRKLSAADSIGADRIRVIDPNFGKERTGVDLRGFEVPLYRGPARGEVQDEAVGLNPSRVNGLLKDGTPSSAPQQQAPVPQPAPTPVEEPAPQPTPTQDEPK